MSAHICRNVRKTRAGGKNDGKGSGGEYCPTKLTSQRICR